MRRQRRKIVGVVVHVVAVAGLSGPPMAAPVMGDDTIAVLEEKQHLGVPVIGRQGPAMAEHDGLTASPVLVEDLRAIRRRDRAHVVLLLPVLVPARARPAESGWPRPGFASASGQRDRPVMPRRRPPGLAAGAVPTASSRLRRRASQEAYEWAFVVNFVELPLPPADRACQPRPARSLHPGRGGGTRLPPRGPLAALSG